MSRALLLIIIFFSSHFCLAENLDIKVFEKAKKGVVSITAYKNIAAYGEKGTFYGTGFLVDKKNGLIITNKHVINSQGPALYEITFFNGREYDAKLVYYDPWHDFAFLKVEPQLIPDDVSELSLKRDGANLNQDVFILGKSEAQDFSSHMGRITSVYDLQGVLPNQTIRISLNIKGGASGSPVCDMKGNVIALLFGGGSSFGLSLHSNYLDDALNYLKHQKNPIRQHNGMIVEYYSLDKATKFVNFPKEKVSEYIKKYPDSFNRALRVVKKLPGSPVYESNLKIGDIIWEIDGEEIGPNLYLLDKKLNQAKDKATIEVFRNGKLVKVKTDVYNIDKLKIDKLVEFGGAIFYQPNDILRQITNARPNRGVYITHVKPGSSFSVFPELKDFPLLINIKSINGMRINSLDDLIKAIPSAIKAKNFTVNYVNNGLYFTFNNYPVISEGERIIDIKYNEMDSKPILYFKENAKDWTQQLINY